MRAPAAVGGRGVELPVGGGVQYEDPDRTRLGGAARLSFTSEQRVTAHANGRLFANVRVAPGWVGARLRTEASYFRVTRNELAVTAGTGAAVVSSSVVHAHQGEVHPRLFLDAEVASFAGFVPALFAGVDVIVIEASASETHAIPLAGVAIVRPTF